MTGRDAGGSEQEEQQLKSSIARWEAVRSERSRQVDEALGRWGFQEGTKSAAVELLEELRAERTIERTGERLAVIKPHREQVDDCDELQRAAAVISCQLTFFKQLTQVDSAIRDQYEALLAEGTQSEPWRTYRDRLYRDTAILGKVAGRALSVMKDQRGVAGRPPRNWRNESFTRLVDSLAKHGHAAMAKRIRLAMDLWNIYFTDPDERFDDEGAAEKIVRGQHKKPEEVKESKGK